jgi:hypothetical protein
MGDCNIIPDIGRRFFISGMYHSVVLNVGIIPDFYIMNVTSEDRVVPNTTVVANLHIANQGCSFSQKTIIPNLRIFSVQRFY